MSERRLLALLALLLGVVGALLVLLDLRLPRDNQDIFAWLATVGARTILGFAVIAGSLFIYGGQYRVGGIVNLVIGVALLLVGVGTAGGLLTVFSGILGLVAAGPVPFATR